jgi:hypothetical protein
MMAITVWRNGAIMNQGIKDLYVCYFDRRLDFALEMVETYWLDLKRFIGRFK